MSICLVLGGVGATGVRVEHSGAVMMGLAACPVRGGALSVSGRIGRAVLLLASTVFRPPANTWFSHTVETFFSFRPSVTVWMKPLEAAS